jgi:hypothetical protein
MHIVEKAINQYYEFIFHYKLEFKSGKIMLACV